MPDPSAGLRSAQLAACSGIAGERPVTVGRRRSSVIDWRARVSDMTPSGLVRAGLLGGSRVWKDESHDKGHHTRKPNHASVHETGDRISHGVPHVDRTRV